MGLRIKVGHRQDFRLFRVRFIQVSLYIDIVFILYYDQPYFCIIVANSSRSKQIRNNMFIYQLIYINIDNIWGKIPLNC